MKKIGFNTFFLAVVIGEMIAVGFHVRGLAFYCKPLLVPAIALIFFSQAKLSGKKIGLLMGFALFFSWGGDVLLMLSSRVHMFFELGVASFLVSQVFYTFLFRHLNSIIPGKPFLKRRPLWILAYAVYGAVIYSVLFGNLSSILKPAVFLYICAIMVMSAMALNRYGKAEKISFALVFAGSLLFVTSDSLIAINGFLVPLPFEGVLVMGTYIAAQYLIMRGVLRQVQMP